MADLDSMMKAQTKSEAQIFLNEYIEDIYQYYLGIKEPKTHNECKSIALSNIGYFAGYYDQETRQRMEQLYEARHPIFGSSFGERPTNAEIFEMGLEHGKSRGENTPTVDKMRFNELTEQVLNKVMGEE